MLKPLQLHALRGLQELADLNPSKVRFLLVSDTRHGVEAQFT